MDKKKKIEDVIKQAKKMLEQIKQHYEDEQTIYFSLLEELSDKNTNRYTETVTKNMFKVSIKDQIPLLQLMVLVKEKNKAICEKYEFLEDGEEE